MRNRFSFARFRGPALALAGLVASACDLDRIIDVQAPDRIVAETFETPGNALTLMAGAGGDLECAYGAHVFAHGVSSDENGGNHGLQAQES